LVDDRIRLMRGVCICGSFRFDDEMVDARNTLRASGVLCDGPTPEARRDPRSMTAEESRKAIELHLERTDRFGGRLR
jgi:hypothetical protein